MTDAILLPLAQADALSGQGIHSVWDFVMKGGPTMYVILLCSLVALTIIVERSIVLRRKFVAPRDFAAAIRGMGHDRSRALELCEANGSPLANVIAAIIRRRGEGTAALREAVVGAGARELVRLRARMRVLGALPQVATMLGLLGTVFGMIKTFQSVAASGQSLGKTEMLAKGIFEAWTCTAAGILVAIVVLVAYHALMSRIDAAAVELDKAAEEFMHAETPTPAVKTAEAPREAAPTAGTLAVAVGS
jgi:biopolymer transport protein ExbB